MGQGNGGNGVSSAADPKDGLSEEQRQDYEDMPGMTRSNEFRRTGRNAQGDRVLGNPAATAASIASAFHTSEQELPVKEMAEKAYGHRDFDSSAPAGSRGPGVPYLLSNNPKAGQWDGRRMSKNKIASYKRFVVTDGEGVRNSIYVSGCAFRCKNCWNASIWDFNAGHDFTPEFERAVIEDLRPDYVEGLTFLGGEPMLNTPVLLKVAHDLRREFGHTKNIWCWTGYTWEELMRQETTPDKTELLKMCDILVDGRFIDSLKNSMLQFRGSSNQRVIDVQKSLAAREQARKEGRDPNTVKPVIWSKLHDLRRAVHEIGVEERGHTEGKY